MAKLLMPSKKGKLSGDLSSLLITNHADCNAKKRRGRIWSSVQDRESFTVRIACSPLLLPCDWPHSRSTPSCHLGTFGSLGSCKETKTSKEKLARKPSGMAGNLVRGRSIGDRWSGQAEEELGRTVAHLSKMFSDHMDRGRISYAQ